MDQDRQAANDNEPQAPEPSKEAFMSEDYDDSDIVIPEQAETAVFVNRSNQVVIRQARWPEDDDVVIVETVNVARLIEAVQNAALEAYHRQKEAQEDFDEAAAGKKLAEMARDQERSEPQEGQPTGPTEHLKPVP